MTEKENIMKLPKVVKVVVNMGTSDMASKNKDGFEKLANDLATITGQKPQVRAAKTSIAGFGIREGLPVGLKVTLRGKRMNDFIDKLVKLTLPRIRDFRGIPVKGIDGSGNYTLGIIEHTVFPEIDLAKVDKPHGLEITVVTNTNSREKALDLLTQRGFPFEKEEGQNKK